MAKSDAENQKAYRERLRKQLGEEEYKRLQREAYRKRKKKLQEEEPKARFFDFLRSWLEVRELRRKLQGMQKERDFRGNLELSEEEKLLIEIEAQELYNFLCENKGNFGDFVLSRRKSLNYAPALETAFYKEISERLYDDENSQLVWEYLYSVLFSALSFTTGWEAFRFQVGLNEVFLRRALQRLSEMNVIAYEEVREEVKGIEPPSIFSDWYRKQPPSDLLEAINAASEDHDVSYLHISRGSVWVDYSIGTGEPEYYPAVDRRTVEEWERSGDPAEKKRAEEVREGVRRAKAQGLKFNW